MYDSSSIIIDLQNDMDKVMYIIKLFFICVCTYYTFLKTTNKKEKSKLKKFLMVSITGVISVISGEIKYILDYLSSLVSLVFMLGVLYTIVNKSEFVYNMINIIICLSINYIIFFITMLISFIPNYCFGLKNIYLNLLIMIIVHVVILYCLFKIKRFKKGLQFLQERNTNEYFYILILNISITIVLLFIVAKSTNIFSMSNIFLMVILISVIIFITIKKTLTMYYKHKMLIKELEETKEELSNKNKEIEKLEKENLQFSKTSHTIAHRQKSLEKKLNKLMMNTEIAEEIDIKERINKISEEYTKEKAVVELSKTGITVIDDMLDCMRDECIENNIEFDLKLDGNIHHMTNNYVEKGELEILLADHIKDAIIAIQHTDNINRSILVRLGIIDGIYSLYIYDTGIEFEIDTLVNLGTKAITTHQDEGGTGMGFLNTFDTLKKHKASMIINEIGKPSKDNYTKVIMIKFDGKDEFAIKSYREEEIKEKEINNNLKIL